jgi:hypothetical protein
MKPLEMFDVMVALILAAVGLTVAGIIFYVTRFYATIVAVAGLALLIYLGML